MSIVVMGYRNEATIAAAVASLLSQAAVERVEVVVVTSGGDGSAAVVGALFGDVTVVESTEQLLPGGARNAGVGATSGGIVAFLAADCLAEPGWVAARLAAHRSGHPVVAGAMTCAPPASPSAWASYFTLFGHRLPGIGPRAISHPDPAAHGLSFDRAVLDRIGPFDADLLIGEDTDAARRLVARDIPVWFEPAVRTAHRGPGDTRALLADQRRRTSISARAKGASLVALSPGQAVWRYPGACLLGTGRTVRVAWRNGRGDRLRLSLCLPWIALARAASQAGTYRERLSVRR
jgi:GT2 family glycosyltransferase